TAEDAVGGVHQAVEVETAGKIDLRADDESCDRPRRQNAVEKQTSAAEQSPQTHADDWKERQRGRKAARTRVGGRSRQNRQERPGKHHWRPPTRGRGR